MSGTPDREVKPKPKPTLVRLSGQNGSPGRGGQPMSRLNTFKAPRDLTLGAAQAKPVERKKFVPNLNVTRNVKKEPEEGGVGGRREERRRGGKRERGERRERKEKPALIQSMGSIFAEGVGGTGGIRRRTGGGGGYDREDGEGGMQRPKLEMNIKYDKEEEEARLKELLRDDFIDDLTTGGYVPVQLPMVDTGKIFKEEVKKEIKMEARVKDDEAGDNIKPSNLTSRPTELDSDDDDPDDVKVPPPLATHVPNQIQPDVSVADLVKTQKGDLLFIQLPDHLPGQKTKREDGRLVCQLDNLEEGCVGKLQIKASGACQLILGDQVLCVEVGTRVGFLQDAVSVQLPQEDGGVGNMTVLGHVKHRLVVTPDWDFLMDKAGLSQSLA